MLRPHHATATVRRRSPTAPQIIAAAVTTLLLLLLSLSVLYSRLLSQDHHPSSSLYLQSTLDSSADADNDAFDGPPDDDRIDVLDDLLDLPKAPLDDEPDEPDSEEDPQFFSLPESESESSSLFFDHALSVHRLSFAKPHQNPDLLLPISDLATRNPKKISISFSSDDQPVDDGVRSKLYSIRTVEDALMVRSEGGGSNGSMREGWVRWLEAKGIS